MNKRWTTMAVCGTVFLTGFAAHAQEPSASLPDITAQNQWRLYQYNKAKGRLAVRPEFPVKVKEGSTTQRQALGIKIEWQSGGEFQFFAVEPVSPLKPIPFTAKTLRAWVHGSGTDHSIEAHFTDADGKEVKTELGSTRVPGWRLLTRNIPSEWKQPVTFRNLTFHNWSSRDPITTTIYVTRLEAVGDQNITTALPLSPAPIPTQIATVVVPTGVPRTISDMNLPGEWRIPPKNQNGGSLSMTDAFPSELQTAPDMIRKSTQVNIQFPGSATTNGFNSFQVEPIQNLPVPYQLIEAKLWLKGTGTKHTFDLLFTDADGKNVNLTPKPGRLEFDGWQQVTAQIPADCLQPLIFRGIEFYSWGVKEPANLSIGMSRLEFVIDPKHPVKREESVTNDAW